MRPIQPFLRIAHRGYSASYPQNTHAAFQAALLHGCDGIELDLQLSLDEVPVVYHHQFLSPVGEKTTPVAAKTLAELRRMDFGAYFGPFPGELIPTLDEVLDRYAAETRLLLEVKVREADPVRLKRLMELVVGKAMASPHRERLEILCFDLDLLAYGHSLAPQLKYVWNQEEQAVFDPDAQFLHAYSLQYKIVCCDFVDQVHAAGKLVYTWTVDLTSVYRDVVAAKVDAVMANDLPRLQRRYEKWLRGNLGT